MYCLKPTARLLGVPIQSWSWQEKLQGNLKGEQEAGEQKINV